MLITQRSGGLLLLFADGRSSMPIAGVPVVGNAGQGGLLDLVLNPEFASNQTIYLSFAERDIANGGLSGTAVAQAELSLARIIFRQSPKVPSSR